MADQKMKSLTTLQAQPKHYKAHGPEYKSNKDIVCG